jgi:hypothetical protein
MTSPAETRTQPPPSFPGGTHGAEAFSRQAGPGLASYSLDVPRGTIRNSLTLSLARTSVRDAALRPFWIRGWFGTGHSAL